MTAPQITIFLDTSGNIHFEAPGKNGAREKLLDLTEDDISFKIYAILLDQLTKERERAKQERDKIELERTKTYNRIKDYTSDKYPSALQYILRDDDKEYRAKSGKSKNTNIRKSKMNKSSLDKAIESIVL